MKQLYVFNPENDLALASDSPYFTPPAAAIKLARSADVLPVWYAGDDDYVLASSSGREWIENLKGKFYFKPRIVESVPDDIAGIVPWGWSRYMRERLLRASVPAVLLHNDVILDGYRACSHRRVSIEMYHCLADMALPYRLPEFPEEIDDVGLISRNLARGQHMFLKSPLSGSGRGIIDTMSAPERQILRLATGVIRRHGSIILEHRLDKIADFAMLFDMAGGKAEFAGYSLFFNAGYSIYCGNVLSNDAELKRMISSYGVPKTWLDITQSAVTAALEQCIGRRYTGPLGVDMMVYDDGGKSLIAPCVEINLRMTMGRVAHTLSERYLSPGINGVMQVIQHPCEIYDGCQVIDGHLVSGTIALTPPAGNDFVIIMKTC